MAHVITGPCIGCKCGHCAEMCSVKAIHESELMLVIDPDVCIDCGACKFACTRNCVFEEENVPDVWYDYIDFNREESKWCPVITESQEPLSFPNWQCDRNGYRNKDSKG